MKKVKLLIMDEDASFRRHVAEHLERERYEIATAENGQKAIELLQESKYDLVITGLLGGAVDGISVLKTAKRIDAETMVIIITAKDDIDSAIEALRNDADDYLLKPCNIDELRYRIQKCMEKQSIQRKLILYENMLSICKRCKKINEGQITKGSPERWAPAESFIQKKARLKMKTTYCPECAAAFADFGIDIGVDADLCINADKTKEEPP